MHNQDIRYIPSMLPTNITVREQVGSEHFVLRGTLHDVMLNWLDISSVHKAAMSAAEAIHAAKAVGTTNPASDYGKKLHYAVTLAPEGRAPLTTEFSFYLGKIQIVVNPFRKAWLHKRIREVAKVIAALRVAQNYSPTHVSASLDVSPHMELAAEEHKLILQEIEAHDNLPYPLFRYAENRRVNLPDGTYSVRKLLVLSKDFSKAIVDFAEEKDHPNGPDESKYWLRVLLHEVWTAVGEDPEACDKGLVEGTRDIYWYSSPLVIWERKSNGYLVISQTYGTTRGN